MNSRIVLALMILAFARSSPPATSAERADLKQAPIRVVEIDPSSIRTEKEFDAALLGEGLHADGYANWFAGRWPYISFIGGMVMGNVSDHLEFFYEKPFKWSTRVLDYVMDGGGRRFGIRATLHPFRDQGVFEGNRSYLLRYRCDSLLKDYHPSYILVNGRRVWDSRVHPLLDGKINVPFWQEQPGNPVIDFVVDLDYTPEVKGLAFRLFHVQYVAEKGVKVTLKGARDVREESPAEHEERFAFGVFPSGYDFWSDRGVAISDLKRDWKPNFRPAYTTDDVWLSPYIEAHAATGPYHDFMVTYGGCNVLGANPAAGILQAAGPYGRGVLAPVEDSAAARKTLSLRPDLTIHWFGGEEGLLAGDERPDSPRRLEQLKAVRDRTEAAKKASGAPDRVQMIWEPFPPALTTAHEYERGRDILVLKNEEDPQYNVMMAMARGAGRSFGKSFGFYWEQTHYPFPSIEFKLQACLLYYFSGGSWIGAEAEEAPSFADGIVAEWVMPYVKALRFAMVHPARGTPVVPIGICWGYGDRWWAPYSPFGQMDTFVRSISYDHATRTFKCEPSFVKRLDWMPEDPRQWRFETTGHLGYFAGHVKELQGYDLLDVFFPKFGDAFTSRIARLLTGTPFGPLDFTYVDAASEETLRSYGMAAFLGQAAIRPEIERKLLSAAQSGTTVVIGAQHLRDGAKSLSAFDIEIPAGEPSAVDGTVAGTAEFFRGASTGRFSGRLYHPRLDGWEPVAWVNVLNAQRSPLVVRKHVGKGAIYLYLGEWIADGGTALRPIITELGGRVAPLRFAPTDDQMEYVAYRKGVGAWFALFNHGAIPVGCDRLKTPRATPPEPLCSVVKGPWTGEITVRPDRLGLDPKKEWALYVVEGIDGPAFEKVIAGRDTFHLRPVAVRREGGTLKAKVTVGKRAEFVVAPPDRGNEVFFGRR